MGFCVPAPVIAQNLPGLQYFRLLGPLFDHLHAVGTARDRAGNRQLFYDQYATLLLCNYPGRLRAPMTSAFTACLGKG